MNAERDGDRGNRDWRSQHLWQFQPVRDVLVFLGIFGIIYLGYVLSAVTVPLLVALLLAYLFDPIVRRLSRVRWLGREGAVVVILAVVVLLVAGFVAGLGYATVRAVGFLERQATYVQVVYDSLAKSETPAQDTDAETSAPPQDEAPSDPDVADQSEETVEGDLNGDGEVSEKEREAAEPWRAKVPPFWEEARDLIVENEALRESDSFEAFKRWVDRNRAQIAATGFATARGALQWLAGTLSSIAMILFGAFLTAFFYFFLATSYPRVLKHGENFLPEKHRDETIFLLKRMDSVIAGFVRGRLTIAVLQGVIFTVAYWLIGVPLPFMVGFVVAILSIVPYLALIGIPLSIILMLVQPSPMFAFQTSIWWALLAPVGVYFALQALDDYVWTPMIQGRSTNMDTPTILFASLSGGVLAGVYGLLLGIPVAACAKILLTEVAWPRFRAWKEGRAPDPLPIGRDNDD